MVPPVCLMAFCCFPVISQKVGWFSGMLHSGMLSVIAHPQTFTTGLGEEMRLDYFSAGLCEVLRINWVTFWVKETFYKKSTKGRPSSQTYALTHSTTINLAGTVSVPVARLETHTHKYYLLAKEKVNSYHDCRQALHRLPLLVPAGVQDTKLTCPNDLWHLRHSCPLHCDNIDW